MAAREPVGVAGGEPQQQLGGRRVGSPALGERVERPVPDVGLVGVRRGLGGDRLGDPDREQPGWTLNTPMPWRLVSRARFSVSLTTAALDTEYADASGQRWTPAWLVMLMIRPRPAATMSGRTSWVAQHETAEVDVHRRPPLVGVDLPQRAERSEDPGVVDEQIDRSQLVAEVGHGRGEAGGDR